MSVSQVPTSLRSWMSAVSEITRAVNAAEPLEEVLNRVAVQACELIGFEFCAVMLADEQRQRLRIAGCSGLNPHYLAQVSGGRSLQIHPPGTALDTPAARAYREDRTIVVPDVRDAASYGRLQDLAPTQGYRALLASPLRGSGEKAGVIVAYSVTAREFGPPELELIDLLGGQVALALETTRLRAGQQETIRELSRANDELRRGRAVLEWAEQQHHQLMQLVLDEVELPGLVGALATALQASVTVEDADGRVLARAPGQGYRPPPDLATRRAGPVRAALDNGEVGGRYQVVRVPDGTSASAPGGAGAWAAPVVLGSELAGRLWVTAPAAEPEPVQLRVIERFALVVALLLLQQRHVLDVQSRLSGDLLGDLLREGGPAGSRAVLDRAAAIGHDLSRPHVVALLAIDGVVPATMRLPELVRAVAEPGPVPMVGPHDGLHVLLQPAEQDPRDMLRRLLAKTAQAVGGHGVVTVVAGPVAQDTAGYATAFRVARGALALHLAGGLAGGFVDAGALGLSALLLETGTPDALRRFSARLLEPLETHERRHGGDLIATLSAWLAAGCSTAAAAQALVVHRNTVTYRLGRVEQLTGRRLTDSSTRLELQMALMIRDIATIGLCKTSQRCRHFPGLVHMAARAHGRQHRECALGRSPLKPPPFDYAAPATLDEAIGLLAEHADAEARVLAGGQSLIPMMNFRLAKPGYLVDLRRVAGLTGIRREGDTLVIGAMTRMAEAGRSPEVAVAAPLVTEAIGLVAHEPVRNSGTVGGSLAHADPAAELPTVALALDAELVAAGPGGTRTIPAADFFTGPYSTALAADEILTEVRLPVWPGGHAFTEFSRIHANFAVVAVAALVDLDSDRIRRAAVALAGVAATPVRAHSAERALADSIADAGTIRSAAEAAAADLSPAGDVHASAETRLSLAQTYLRRGLELAVSRARNER